MTRTILFRADGGHDLGFGHIKRCLSLASELASQNIVSAFACRCESDAVATLIRARGFSVVEIPARIGLIAELEYLSNEETFDYDAIVLDISHPEMLRQYNAIPAYFAGLTQRFPAVAIIDGHMQFCLAGRFDLPVDLIALPHAAAQGQLVLSRSSRILRGLDFFVLDSAFATLGGNVRETPETASRLLVTAGGSDPTGITLKTLRALEQSQNALLDVRIVIGPAFADDVASETKKLAADSRHRVTTRFHPDNLAEDIAWCDMAVSASGLTKYELAAMGVPAILLSIDDNHATLTQAFDAFGTACHLGQVDQVTTTVLAKAIADLLADRDTRSAMSSAGPAILDGRGATRLATAIIATMDAVSKQNTGFRVSEAPK